MQSFTGLIRVDDYDQSLRDVAMPFDEALQGSLYGNDACLLTICANTCAIVNGRGKFAFVDSHINSNVNRKGQRASCVSYFNCLQSLIRHPSCFRKMKFLSPDDALKVQVQIQALAIDVKRAQKQLARIEQGVSASPQQNNTSKSLLDTLLDSDSEGEDSTEGIGQEDSGEGETVRN